MSLLLTSGRQNAEKRPKNALCCYCSKVIKDPRALGSHLRAHWGLGVSRKSLDALAHSSNSLNVTKPAPKPLKAAPLRSSSSGSGNLLSSAFSKPDTSPKPYSVFPERFGCEHWLTSKFTSKITAKPDDPYLSSGTGMAELSQRYQVPDPSSCTAPNTFPLNHSYPLGSDVVFQYNTNPSLTLRLGDGGRFSGKYSNHCNYTIASPDSHIGSNQWPVFNGPTNVCPFFPNQNQHPEQGEVGGYNKCVLAPRGKKRYSSEVSDMPAMMNPLKRIELHLMIETEKHHKKVKELLLFKDYGNLGAGLEKSFYANEEVQTDLDLSLHL